MENGQSGDRKVWSTGKMESEGKAPPVETDRTERVTLAIAERSIEGAWCEGYRTGVLDMAAIALAALSVYAIVRIMSSE